MKTPSTKTQPSAHTAGPRIFKTTVLGLGPFCVEFEDGEIITTRSETRQRRIAATEALLDTTQPSAADLRAAFENWAQRKGYDLRRCTNPHCDDGKNHYREGSGMNLAFEAYQAGFAKGKP